jgi:hypothetical protein
MKSTNPPPQPINESWMVIDAFGHALDDFDFLESTLATRDIRGLVVPIDVRADELPDRSRLDRLHSIRTSAGLTLAAAVDFTAVGEILLTSHPEFLAMDAKGDALERDGRPTVCVFQDAYPVAAVDAIKKVIQRTRAELVVGTNWTGLARRAVCYCPQCQRHFSEFSGKELPVSPDLGDLAYKGWTEWGYARTERLWLEVARATQSASDGATQWTGVVPTGHDARSTDFIDLYRVGKLAPLLFVDFREFTGKGRAASTRNHARTISDATLSQAVGIMPWSMEPEPGDAAGPGLETVEPLELATCAELLTMYDIAIAASHHVWKKIRAGTGAKSAVTRGHLANGSRRQRAHPNVGVLWSRHNRDNYGGEWSALLVDAPYNGIASALDRMSLPFRSVSVEALQDRLDELALLVLPNIAAMDRSLADLVTDYASRGGSVLATCDTGRFDLDGNAVETPSLGALLGVDWLDAADRLGPITANVPHGFMNGPPLGRLYGPATEQSYLRLRPELARATEGPHVNREPAAPGTRHAVLNGFDNTDLIAFGGLVSPAIVKSDRFVPMTVVPGFPSAPIDNVYPLVERTEVPGVVLGQFGKGRVAYLTADIDRRFGIDPIPDHLAILRNVVEWLLPSRQVFVSYSGQLASELSATNDASFVHLLNLTGFDRRGGQSSHLAPIPTVRISLPGKVPVEVTQFAQSEVVVVP